MAKTNLVQHFRTAVSGNLPNTSNVANTSYIAFGELAINGIDKKMHSSNGTILFEIGANVINQNVTNSFSLAGISVASINSTANSTQLGANSATELVTSQAVQLFVTTRPAGSAVPAGANTQIQFNSSGAFAGDVGLTYNLTTQTLAVANAITHATPTADTSSAVSATTAFVQNAVGTTNIATTGGTVTLTTAQAGSQTIYVTGTLASNVILNFGSSTAAFFNRAYMILNNTTGAFTLTVQACATTPGTAVTITQGALSVVNMNGANAKAASTPIPYGLISAISHGMFTL